MSDDQSGQKRRLTKHERAKFNAGVRRADELAGQMKAFKLDVDSPEESLQRFNDLNRELQRVIRSIEHLEPFAD